MFNTMFDARYWAMVPFHFWSVVFFAFGAIVGSFLNVCIHRLPLGQSVVSPPSHCPHCKYSIPWYLNVPLVTWLYLQGKCANCKAPISIRYFLVELLTAVVFMVCWLTFGHQSAGLALVYCLFMAGLIVATFVDFEHFIIPDEITVGGAVAGVVCSVLVPAMHGKKTLPEAVQQSMIGLVAGAGVIYGILRIGKFLFGRQKLSFADETRIVFTETALYLPEGAVPYEEVFYRRSDAIVVEARTVELADRCYKDVKVRLRPEKLEIGEESFNPDEVPHMETTSGAIVLPREAMGLGDVKFMAAIGAFLGWQAVIFSLMVSSMIGSLVGVSLIAMRKQEWSSRLPYGPYIALAAALWIFGGQHFVRWWFGGM